jgi:hypothetical protein
MKKTKAPLLLAASILASLGGIVLFIVLFIPDLNIFWIILSPVILVIYQLPAVLFFRLWKRKNTPPE